MLFSEPKIPQIDNQIFVPITYHVSVLFSEPKIPQTQQFDAFGLALCRFSALQRAENSSKVGVAGRRCELDGFSALQRAENSSN